MSGGLFVKMLLYAILSFYKLLFCEEYCFTSKKTTTSLSYRRHVITNIVHETPLGSNNQAFRSSTREVSSSLHSVITNHVMRADSQPSLTNDEVRSFGDEGLDSDVDDLSELESGEDSDNADNWNSHFVALGQV